MEIKMSQKVAILIDGNNIEIGIKREFGNPNLMLDFDNIIPKLIKDRGLNRLKYFREGRSISPKFAERLQENFHGTVRPCHKTADIPLTIEATQLADKVDTIILMSGDSDYIELVRYLKHKGVRVEIACFEKSASSLLIREADYHYWITKDDLYEFKPKF